MPRLTLRFFLEDRATTEGPEESSFDACANSCLLSDRQEGKLEAVGVEHIPIAVHINSLR